MTQPKRATAKKMSYAELAREFRDVQSVVVSHSKLLEKMDNRVSILEDDKKAETIAKKAVENYQRDEERKRRDAVSDSTTKTKAEIMTRIAYILGLLGVALYAYLASKGIHP